MLLKNIARIALFLAVVSIALPLAWLHHWWLRLRGEGHGACDGLWQWEHPHRR